MNSSSWIIFIMSMGVLGASLLAYKAGHDEAEAQGLAALNALKVERSEEKRRAADAYGKALADTLKKYQSEVSRGDALVAALKGRDRRHAEERQKLQKEIAHVAKRSTLVLDPDTVRLLNRAAGADGPAGAGISDDALSGALCAAGPDGGASGCAPARAGLLANVSTSVTEADLIAWFSDFASRSRWLEDRLLAWQQLYRGHAIPARGE